MDDIVMVPQNVALAPLMGPNEARLNITMNGVNADLPDPVRFDATDAEVLGWATEAVHAGIPGMNADPTANFVDFVVDRFTASPARPWNIIMCRPKTPFGFTT